MRNLLNITVDTPVFSVFAVSGPAAGKDAALCPDLPAIAAGKDPALCSDLPAIAAGSLSSSARATREHAEL
jgi:hypothetical protein